MKLANPEEDLAVPEAGHLVEEEVVSEVAEEGVVEAMEVTAAMEIEATEAVIGAMVETEAMEVATGVMEEVVVTGVGVEDIPLEVEVEVEVVVEAITTETIGVRVVMVTALGVPPTEMDTTVILQTTKNLPDFKIITSLAAFIKMCYEDFFCFCPQMLM